MTSLPPAISARLAQDEALVRTARLQDACRTQLWLAQTPQTRGVALLLHGFTAGPWQFTELGPLLSAAGLVAYAVRLPGHGARAAPRGQTTLQEDPSGLPRSRQHALFGEVARAAWAEALALAKAHGVPLYVVGHSAGGAMALDLLHHPDAQVERAVLVAPLLRPKRRISYLFTQWLSALPLVGTLADRLRLSWPNAVPRPDGWVRPGHRNVSLGNAMALFRYAKRVRRALSAAARRGHLLPPIQFICTATDDKVDLEACRRLAAMPPKRHFLHCFAVDEAVPHAMLTRWENPQDAARQHIHQLARDFLLTGTGADSFFG